MSDTKTTYYLQATTNKLHRVKSCSITRATRYDHFVVELTDAEVAAHPLYCAKCFDVEKPAPMPRTITIEPAAIAEALRDERETAIALHETYHAKGITVAAKRIAHEIGDQNHRFDVLSFLRAVGLNDDEIASNA